MIARSTLALSLLAMPLAAQQVATHGVNTSRLRSQDLGESALDRVGSVLYLPLQRGKNELVFAVTEYTGGWAFWARLDPARR